MDVSGDLFIVADDPDQIVGQVLGMGGHEADPLQALYPADLLQKLRKAAGLLQVLAVGVDILAQQHNLHDSVGRQTLTLPQDLDGSAASLPSPHIGDDAVAAEIVASEGDVGAGFKGIFAGCGQGLDDPVGPVPDLDHHSVGLQRAAQVLGKTVEIVGAEDQVDKAVALLYLFDIGLFLDHASADRDLHARAVLFEMAGPSQPAEDALVGIVPDRAGIVDQKIRVLGGRLGKARALEDPDDLFRIPGVHLTAEGLDAEGQSPAGGLRARADDLPGTGQKPGLPVRLGLGGGGVEVRGQDQVFKILIYIHRSISSCSWKRFVVPVSEKTYHASVIR